MYKFPDWSSRKQQIGMAFRAVAPVPPEADSKTYEALLRRIGVTTPQDLRVLCAVVRDAIMTARREERPTTPLDLFLDWLESKRDNV